MVTYVFPIVGVVLGVAFLSEILDARLVIGTALVLAGIGIVSLRYDAVVRRAARGRKA
jgi:drug/metabolite transporter (DMT)-like permease